MKKFILLILILFVITLSSCSNNNKTSIFIGEDGYWYVNNQKTGTYSIGNNGTDGKSAYELAVEKGYKGTLDEWLNSLNGKDGNLKVFDTFSNTSLDSEIKVENGKIFLIVKYLDEITVRKGVLAELIYENKSFYEVFEEYNNAPVNMETLKTETDTYINNSNAKLQTKTFNSLKKALAIESNSSEKISSNNNYTGTYYVAAKVNCTRYESGNVGIFFEDNTNLSATISKTTSGFETTSGIITANNQKILIGSNDGSKLDAYIDDTVVIDLSMFDIEPSIEELNTFYEEYLKIVKGEIKDSSYNDTILREERFLLGEKYQEYTNTEAKAAFMSYMNKKAKEIGMKNSEFIDAAGFYNKTTALDLLRLGIYACGYDEIVSTWHKNTYSITINGSNPRIENITTTVASSKLEDYYFLFGGKTGTVDGHSNLLAIVEGPDERLFCVAVIGAVNNRFEAAKQALDAAMLKYYDKNYDNSNEVVEAKSAAVCIVPKNNTLAYTDYPLTMLYEKNSEAVLPPASITKVLTSICMLDFVADINESFMVNRSDVTGGSGYFLYDGDIITYREAIHAMLLPSSNTCAEATATAVGHKILQYANK